MLVGVHFKVQTWVQAEEVPAVGAQLLQAWVHLGILA